MKEPESHNIPKPEPIFGEIDKAIQLGLFIEDKVVTIYGKGTPVKLSLEAWGRLQDLKKGEK